MCESKEFPAAARRTALVHIFVDLNVANAQFRPGHFLNEYRVSNESYCTFKYNLPDKFRYAETDLEYSPELAAKSSYRVLYNVLEAKETLNSSAPVTYATHVTPEFINYISEIARHWDGLISVAAFVPDDDADFITSQLLQICQCLPEMSKVSVHYVFPKSYPPYIKNHSIPTTCTLQDSSTHSTYRTTNKLPYPVNIGRNVARRASKTDYVLVSDVELMPSDRLASKFEDMMKQFASLRRLSFPSRVFVVPVFEIEEFEAIPRSKDELVKLIREEKALYFHRHICSHCQKFPGLETWIQHEANGLLKPLMVVKREYPFHRWEPIYIGTKNEPFYSERLSWEGKQDKMTQMLEMCLKGYVFIILDNAFLIHWPGVKRKSPEMKLKAKWRLPYLMKNTRQYNQIISHLATTHKNNPKCKLQ
ncbi:PREDICTED: beta-1,4-glucuronyltransferase 1-like isoform X2 [Nicrophorus vespilloides]|uniref:Beta-1,4-glucuronyltransferase 1-like isoform X2 n=1 Tax=Nicrophorus vespilloides TaxID=110193 RepID=A0ABM1MZ79_NICVS|nr:PREDICTED: beta-1,4-glucuronyltransferase 1-like isoform X2 [Nicrophorus vespilloides]